MKLYFAFLALCAGAARAEGLPPTGTHNVEHLVQRELESTQGRTIGIELWHPADRNSGPFPLLLFSPGFGNNPSQYLSQVEELASHGYIVVGLTHPADGLASFEMRAVLWAQDILAAKKEVFQSPLGGIIDRRRIGAFGHSLGGRASAGACLLDSTILACLNQDGGSDDIQLKRPYWPMDGRVFAGAFAMLDWFDPGIDEDDLRTMGKSREQYAASRLEPSPVALDAYRAARGGALRITMLTSGMRHTAFTDDPWSAASSGTQRTRYANYLRQVREITLDFFDKALNRNIQNSVCDVQAKETYTQCFKSTDAITPP